MKQIDVNEKLIVFVIYKGITNWYVSDKDIWYLDKNKRINCYRNLGYEIKIEYVDERRRDILLLDTDNADIFLSRIKGDIILTSELKEIWCNLEGDERENRIYNYMPSLYVDFDKKVLLSIYSEPASYEDYAPIGWKAGYDDFKERIPKEYYYWE